MISPVASGTSSAPKLSMNNSTASRRLTCASSIVLPWLTTPSSTQWATYHASSFVMTAVRRLDISYLLVPLAPRDRHEVVGHGLDRVGWAPAEVLLRGRDREVPLARDLRDRPERLVGLEGEPGVGDALLRDLDQA